VASWRQIARRIRVPLGFVLAVTYLWLANPRLPSLLLGVVFVVLGLSIRALASGHVQKNEQLTMTGPYAYTRNPLYLGSLILSAGFAIAARSLWVVVILSIMLVAIYLPVIRAEEAYLAERFPEFREYARHVPRLVPAIRPFADQHASFSWTLYRMHREYNATIGSVAVMAALVVKLMLTSR